jgi:arylsulfatase A-like enzyme
LFVLLDDLSWVGTSVQMDPSNPNSKSDYHQTPVLEQLAQQGMVFSNAYAAGPMCSPTRAALMTGKSPAQLQVTDVRQASNPRDPQFQWYNGFPLTPPQPRGSFPQETTIPEAIKASNPSYRTSFWGKYDWQPNMPWEKFDVYNDLNGWRPPADGQDPIATFFNTNNAMSFMETQVQANRPFFTYLSHDAVKINGARQETHNYFNSLPRGQKHFNPLIAATHKDADTSIGMLLDKLETLGIDDNTYVVFTSDHGASWDLGNAIQNSPLFGGKGSLWEGALRVPLIIKGPGVTPGTYSDVPVTSADLYATFMDMVGSTLPLPAGVEGTSLKPILENGGQLPPGQTSLQRAHGPNGELFFHYPHYTGYLVEDGGGEYHYAPVAPPNLIPTPGSAIIDGDFKLVRFYGEQGGPDKYLLFNLAQNLSESADVNSPLNLAAELPEKVQQMRAKLDNWLEAVDASLPYDVSVPVEMEWDAAMPGTTLLPNSADKTWRSVNDMDSLGREEWYSHGSRTQGPNGTPPSATGVTPARVTTAPHQPGLPRSAFSFDGNDGFSHAFFHVSDATRPALFDGDHSATVETWVRIDALTSNQLLFESGSATQGMSLTVGDGDADSFADELRFRVLGKAGNQVTVTVDMNQFADPTREFIHIAAVLSDSPTARYAELYVNGALLGHVDGVLGAQALDWDSPDPASMGRLGLGEAPIPDSLGGADGSGPLPFANGNLKGSITTFKFANRALAPGDIHARYNAMLHPVTLGIQAVGGQASMASVRPSNVSAGAFESDVVHVVQERNDSRTSNLYVDARVNGPMTLTASHEGFQNVRSGDFTSYLLHFDPIGSAPGAVHLVTGSVTFAEDIIGLITANNLMRISDPLAGSIGNYGTNPRGIDWNPGDFLTVSSDQRTLSFQLTVPSDDLVQFRVLTDLTLGLVVAAGDLNRDGTVDGQDLSVWKAAFGQTDLADADGDGDSDGADFLAWQRNLQVPPSGSATAVPEASGLVLLSLGLLALSARRRTPAK